LHTNFTTPVARFTSEGGFERIPELDWNSVTEHEMNGRLNKLMAAPEERFASFLPGRA
jgi:hypothetical protein